MVATSRLSRVAAALALALLVGAAPAKAQNVDWNDDAGKELAAALHHMHHVWNSGDIESLKSLMVGDAELVSFELDPATHRPVLLGDKSAIDRFIDRTVQELNDVGAVTLLDEPVVNCRATNEWGVCTEQCTIRVEMPGGEVRIDRLWSTAVAVRYPSGWRWVQWHMSVAGAE